MPQMMPSWWTILFTFNIFVFTMINMMIYFNWNKFNFNKKFSNMKWKKFIFNDKNF